jgi:hypothetical protein
MVRGLHIAFLMRLIIEQLHDRGVKLREGVTAGNMTLKGANTLTCFSTTACKSSCCQKSGLADAEAIVAQSFVGMKNVLNFAI